MRWHENYGEEEVRTPVKPIATRPAAASPLVGRSALAAETVPSTTGLTPASQAEPVRTISTPITTTATTTTTTTTTSAQLRSVRPTVVASVPNNSSKQNIILESINSVRPAVVPRVNVSRSLNTKTAPKTYPKVENTKSGYEAVCASCGITTTTVFVPDGIRPVYCKDCLSKKKEEKRLEVESRRVAKEVERRKFDDEIPVPPANSFSLDDLKNLSPVDFRGRTIKNTPPQKSSDTDSDLKSDSVENELEEGVDVKF